MTCECSLSLTVCVILKPHGTSLQCRVPTWDVTSAAPYNALDTVYPINISRIK